MCVLNKQAPEEPSNRPRPENSGLLKKKKKGSISALFFSQQQGPHVIYNRNNKTLQVGYLCLTTVLAPNRIQKVATVSIEKDSKEKKFQTTFSFLGAIKAQQGLCCLLRVTPSH